MRMRTNLYRCQQSNIGQVTIVASDVKQLSDLPNKFCSAYYVTPFLRIIFMCDNDAVTHAIRSGTSQSPEMRLTQAAVLLCSQAQLPGSATAKHTPGKLNVIADALSRFNMQVFRQAAPDADLNPSTPAPLPSINI